MTAESLEPFLDVVNQLFLGFESYDCRVRIASKQECFQHTEVDERENPGKSSRYTNFWSPWRITVVDIGTVAIGLTLFETSEEVEMVYKNGKYVPVSESKPRERSRYYDDGTWTTTKDIPTGRFCLQAYSPYRGISWEHLSKIPEKGEKLPRWVNKVIKELEQSAETISRLANEAEKERELRHQQLEAQF